MNETVEAPVAAITATAPVTALLLLIMAFNKTDWSLEDILELNSSIVDKVCRSGTSVGSRDIGAIVEDLIDANPFPDAKDEMHWRDPKTGAEVVFPLQHAIDYAFYVDGHVTPVPDTVGTAFCKPPSQTTRTATASRTRSRANRSGASLELFNTPINEDDDYDYDAGDAIPESPEQNSAVDSAGARRSRNRYADDQGSDLLLENKRVNAGKYDGRGY
ncbi:hypothetical protein PHMEG_00039300 [Phytophthora megakarya]|uniref:Uncharacterized protein n=1 Tax=Phytophthora megakarya TaxID=4795 RepID=A0A225UFW2_9STRA|nr:hypothetical protein PHMEG_00039300 [Phytophthora megakarya]